MSREKAIEAVKAALQREFGGFLAQDPYNPERFWTMTATAVVDAATPHPLRLERDQVARAIDPESWRYFDTGKFPPDHPASVTVVRQSREAADRVLTLITAAAPHLVGEPVGYVLVNEDAVVLSTTRESAAEVESLRERMWAGTPTGARVVALTPVDES